MAAAYREPRSWKEYYRRGLKFRVSMQERRRFRRRLRRQRASAARIAKVQTNEPLTFRPFLMMQPQIILWSHAMDAFLYLIRNSVD
jgi:hypothetical protein